MMNKFSKKGLAGGLLLLLLVAAGLLLLRFATGFNGLYGQDSHEYLRYAQRLADFFTSGADPGDYFWPVNYPLYGALLSLLTGDVLTVLQLISITAFLLTLVYIIRFISLFYPQQPLQSRVYAYIGLVVCLSPLMLQSALVIMSDMLAVFFTTAAVYHMLAYRDFQERRDFYLAIFLAGSAVMTRYATAVILLIPAVAFLRAYRPHIRWQESLWGLAIILFCVAPHFLIRAWQSAAFLEHPALVSWSIENWFKQQFNTTDGFASYRFLNLLYGFINTVHPAFFFLGGALAFFIRKKDLRSNKQLLLLASIVLYGLFLAGIPYQNLRFLLLSFPLVVVLMYPLFSRSIDRLLRPNFSVYLFVGVVVTIQLGLNYKYSSGTLQSNLLEQRIARTMKSYDAGEDKNPIYTFWIDSALKTYGIKNPIVNLWHKKLESADSSGLVLFNESSFRQQWQGKNPMQNWEFLKENYQLQKIEELPQGWELYRLEPSRTPANE